VKRLLTLIALLPAAALAGPGMLGTRTEAAPVAGGSSPVGILPMIQMMVALAIVVALVKFVLPKFLGKVAKPTNQGEINIESTAALNASGSLHIVTARGRTLLIGATPTGMTCLADLTEDAEEISLPEETSVAAPTKFKSFEEMLASATIPTPEPAAAPARPVDDVARALERLRALED
jgi:flagellar biogenesis protein FliO